MKDQIETTCDKHSDPFACPDCVISYSEKFDEYGLIIHDGGHSSYKIAFCPFCGTKLPKSKRDRWFDELEKLGVDATNEESIPSEYRTRKWYS